MTEQFWIVCSDDEIGGWSRKSVGAQYGNGYTLEKKQEALIKMLAV